MNVELIKQADSLNQLLHNMIFTYGSEPKREISSPDLQTCHHKVIDSIKQTKQHGGAVYIIGNGGSAAIASHAKTDFMNVNGVRAITLLEPAIMTCLSNDNGYDTVFSRQISTLARKQDTLIAISSSGNSANIINAVDAMKQVGGVIISLSGFERDNRLRTKGDFNYWIDSKSYMLVEIAHLFVLHYLADFMNTSIKV